MTDIERFEFFLGVALVLQWLAILATPFIEVPNWIRTALYGGLAATFIVFGAACETILDEEGLSMPGAWYLAFAIYVLIVVSILATVLAPVPFLGTDTMLIGAWVSLTGAVVLVGVNESLFVEDSGGRDPNQVPDDPMEMINNET